MPGRPPSAMGKRGGLASSVAVDRRQHVRVVANRSAILYDRRTVRGRLSNISTGGMHVRLGGGEPRSECGETPDVELHLYRSGAEWLRFRGEVMRATEHEVAVGFSAVP